jgi:lysyl-tRNA synthetase, class II
MVGLPHRFADRSAVADVLAVHDALEPGASSGARYRLAGRVLGRRGMGKASFLDLEDRSGRIQLMASLDGLGAQYEQLLDVNLGDIVGVSGEAVRSRRGELSLQLDSYQLLAPCERPLPDKHHGLADVETRYRQRYLDLLINPEVRAEFELRARAITALRRELDGAGFIEVETPVLQPLYGGANARPFTTHHNELDRDLYLRIATELYLKRLIVGGLERVYEIGKDFRNEGVSFKHNPEFTLLEWYEAYADVDDAMTRTESLVAAAAVAANGTTRVTREGLEVDLAPPWPRIPLAQAIEERSGIDPLAVRDPDELRRLAVAAGAAAAAGDKTWPQLVDRLLSHFVEPNISTPVFLVDYPVELSPLARRREDDPSMTERFEAFVAGMEIANGFSELNDADDQLSRFQEQVRNREAGDEDAQPLDEDYVEALRYGMPPTGGVGLGIDRLVMLLSDRRSIRDVILFPALRT